MADIARSRTRDAALSASALAPTVGFMALSLATIMGIALMGLQAGSFATAPDAGAPSVVATPELTITTPPRAARPELATVDLAGLGPVVKVLAPSPEPAAAAPRPVAAPPGRAAGPPPPASSEPPPVTDPVDPVDPTPDPTPDPDDPGEPGPPPLVKATKADCKVWTSEGGITEACVRFCRAKLRGTGDVPDACSRWCPNVATSAKRVTAWYRWCGPVELDGEPIWAYTRV